MIWISPWIQTFVRPSSDVLQTFHLIFQRFFRGFSDDLSPSTGRCCFYCAFATPGASHGLTCTVSMSSTKYLRTRSTRFPYCRNYASIHFTIMTGLYWRSREPSLVARVEDLTKWLTTAVIGIKIQLRFSFLKEEHLQEMNDVIVNCKKEQKMSYSKFPVTACELWYCRWYV